MPLAIATVGNASIRWIPSSTHGWFVDAAMLTRLFQVCPPDVLMRAVTVPVRSSVHATATLSPARATLGKPTLWPESERPSRPDQVAPPSGLDRWVTTDDPSVRSSTKTTLSARPLATIDGRLADTANGDERALGVVHVTPPSVVCLMKTRYWVS